MFKVTVAFVIALCLLACSESGSPTEPQVYEPPAFFPLAEGASWEYSFESYDSFRGSSAGPYNSASQFGSLNLTVVESSEVNALGEFLVRVDFKLDSLKSHQAMDTSIYCAFEASQDQILYTLEDSQYVYFSMDNGTRKPINLNLFTLGLSNAFDVSLQYNGTDENGDQRYSAHDSWFWEINAVFSESAGGLKHLEYGSRDNLTYLGNHRSKTFELVEYIAGQPGNN
ncbi:MAG: hypothetical protein HOC20_14285 [Chloroflexi bacterium]|nr:hypothetical protein [Chloroflexota bacterium]